MDTTSSSPVSAQSLTIAEAHLAHQDIIHHLVECSGIWQLIINRELEVIYCSTSCEKMTGYPAEMFIKHPILMEEIVHSKHKHKCPTQLLNNIEERSHLIKEYCITTSTGKEKWIISLLNHVRLKGKPDNHTTLISSIDISPYKQKSLRLAEEYSALLKKNKELVRKLAGAICEVNHSESKLMARNKELENVNQELIEANNALKMLAKNLNIVKIKTEEALLDDIYRNIYPLVEKLKKTSRKTSDGGTLEVLSCKLDNLCKKMGNRGSALFLKALTPTEIKVASLIKEGLRSKEIAKELNISPGTVKTHRRNIRRKLRIQNAKISLSSYLKIKWHTQK